MFKLRTIALPCSLALVAGVILATNQIAVAQQSRAEQSMAQQPPKRHGKVSHEEAWRVCLDYMNRVVPNGELDTHQVAQFRACMARLGVRP